MSLFLFTNALSSALGEAVTPAIADPYLIWVWAGPAIGLFLLTVHFYFTYRSMDHDEFMTEANDNVSQTQLTRGVSLEQTSDGGHAELDEKSAEGDKVVKA